MKRIFTLIFLLLIITISVSAQNKQGAFIVTKPDTVNIGEISLDDLSPAHGKVQITILNSGNQPLIVNEASGCCGTDVKEWPKAPILPGNTGIVKVEFRIEPRPQVISRTITVKSNAANQKIIKVPITGIIIVPKAKNEITL
ncbi:MAG: DUF1573 domain-containing protein [Tenuifilaceae bacterium]